MDGNKDAVEGLANVVVVLRGRLYERAAPLLSQRPALALRYLPVNKAAPHMSFRNAHARWARHHAFTPGTRTDSPLVVQVALVPDQHDGHARCCPQQVREQLVPDELDHAESRARRN